MVIDDKSIAINALIDAVTTIEQVLGITPYGVYSDVRVRLDVLEARINNPNVPSPNVTNPFYIDGYTGVSISVGTEYPTEDRTDGSLYMIHDGYNYEGIFVRRGNAWELIPTVKKLYVPLLSGSATNATDGYIVIGATEFDPSILPGDGSGTRTIKLQVLLETSDSGVPVNARLYNYTTSSVVSGSTVTTSSEDTVLLTSVDLSDNISVDSAIYQAQINISVSGSDTATCTMARLLVEYNSVAPIIAD